MAIGCSKRSGRDKGISFYRIPVIIKERSKQEFELSKKRRNGFFIVIPREDLSLRRNATTFRSNILCILTLVTRNYWSYADLLHIQ